MARCKGLMGKRAPRLLTAAIALRWRRFALRRYHWRKEGALGMKLPYVTIEYREEESFAIGKTSAPLVIGFGLHWAWVYLSMYNGHTLFHTGEDSFQTPAFVISLAVFACTLLSYGVFFWHARALFATRRQRQRNRLIATFLMFASTFLLLFTGIPGTLGGTCSIVSGVLSGIGSAVMLMSFGVSFSACDVAETSLSAALALLVAAASCGGVLLVDSLAHPAGALLCTFMPFVELLLLNRSSHQIIDNLVFQTCTIPVKLRPFCWRICLPCLIMGITLGFIRAESLCVSQLPLGLADFTIIMLLASASACLVIILAMFTQRNTSYFMFRTLLPAAAVLMTAMVTPLGENATFYTFGMLASCFMLEACMWIMLADVSQRFRISAFTVFGFGRGMLAIGAFIAFAVPAGGLIPDITSQNMPTFIAVILLLLILAHAFLPTTSEVRKTLKRGQSCPAFMDDSDPMLSEHRAAKARKGAAEARGSVAKEGAAAAGVCGNAAVNKAHEDATRNGIAGNATATQATADGAIAGTNFPTDASGTPTTTDKLAESPDKSADGNPGETTGGISGGGACENLGTTAKEGAPEPSADTSPADLTSQNIGRFKRKCLMVADTYLLSRKETEVLFLLAKGRNSAAIQESLYISAGTVNTHMRNIYRKLNVHSHQELIELVESVEIED